MSPLGRRSLANLALVAALLSARPARAGELDLPGAPGLAEDHAETTAPTLTPAPLAQVLRELDDTYSFRSRPENDPDGIQVGGLAFDIDGIHPVVVPGVSIPFELNPRPLRALREPRVHSRVRTGSEVIALFGYGFADYWRTKDVNAVDWELSFSTPSFRKKLITFEAVRFDTNKYETNTVSHPAAGTFYYLAARGNGLGLGESFLFSFFTSAFWEYLGEYREKVSLNDLVMTPQGGIAFGEPLHQLGLLFERGKDDFIHQALAATFSPFHFLHKRLGHWFTARARSLDEIGLPTDTWHRFDTLIGVSAETGKDGLRLSDTRLGLSTEIIDMPDYDRPGVHASSMRPGSVTSLRVVGSFDDRGMHQFDVATRVLLGGVRQQDIQPNGRGGLNGYSLFLGPSTAFTYAMHMYDRKNADKIAHSHPIGLSIDAAVYRGRGRARVGLDILSDFSAVYAEAIDEWLAASSGDSIKTVLADKKYYFAVGVTLRPTVVLSYRRLEIGAQTTQDFLESIEGVDRYQESISNDFHLSDTRSNDRAWIAYTLPGTQQRTAWLEIERIARTGHIGALRVSRASTDIRAGLSLRF